MWDSKEKKWGKKWMDIFAIKAGGLRRLMANVILNSHFLTLPLGVCQGIYQAMISQCDDNSAENITSE